MNLTLKRNEFKDTGVYGEFLDEGGKRLWYSLEHSYQDDNGDWAPKMPAGVYTCTRYKSPHFGYDVFVITGVPGHDHIEIHCGNAESDSEGCVLIGQAIASDMIAYSRLAFNALMEAQKDVDSFTLTVE